MRCGRKKTWYHCKSEIKFTGYFTKSQTFSAHWSFTYASNKLGDSVADRTDSESKCHFEQ